MSSRSTFNVLRVIPREDNFLDRKVGSRGEVFFDKETNSLRLYDGVTAGGFSLARADLSNIPNETFAAKVVSSGFSGGVQAGLAGRLAFYPSSGSQVNDLAEVYWHEHDGQGMLHVDGVVQVSGQKNLMRFHWDTLEDLEEEVDPVEWHGMLAHVHETGRVYFAHAGAWVPLANFDEISASTTSFSTISVAGQDNVVADSATDTLTIVAGSGITITTNSGSDSITISSSAVANNAFTTVRVAGQDDVIADSSSDILTLVAGTGISLATNNGSDSVTITATTNVTSINDLLDVDTNSSPPVAGQVLKWNGTAWAPGTDATVGGAGTDADTLDGFDSTYFLNYNNLSNKPSIPSAIFSTIAVAGQSSVLADSVTDTLTFAAGTGISITTNAVTDTVTITNTVTNTTYGISSETATGGVNLRLSGSDSTTDDVKFAAGSHISIVRTDANTITISSSSDLDGLSDVVITSPVSGQVLKYNGTSWVNGTDATSAGAASNSFETIAVAGQTSVVAESTTDTLTLVAGTGISITTDASADSITITNTVQSPDFNTLGQTSSANLTVDKIYLPAITRLVVTNSGATAYRFDQYGTSNNPTIYAISGTTIAFEIQSSGHPFLIQDGTGTNYNTGLVHVSSSGVVSTGSSAQGQTSGTLYWKVPIDISGGYRYQCSLHAPMVGSITIKSFASI